MSEQHTHAFPSTLSAFTSEQLQAILAENHLVIDAGAGSGKTSTLVEKIVFELGATVDGKKRETPRTLDQIVAVTFTNSAAADLRRKLRARLRREEALTGESRWAEMVYEVDRAEIGTIHSFCSSVLHDYSLRVGLNPYFKVLEERESAVRLKAAVHDTLMETLHDMDDTAIELVAHCGVNTIVELVGIAAANPSRAGATIDAWHDEDGHKGVEFADRVRHLITKWKVTKKKTPSSIFDVPITWDCERDVKLTASAFWILRAGCRARELMQERCDAAGEMDYDALITRTLVALNIPPVLQALRSRLAWVFIDELQDTDPAQLEIGYRLCGLSGPADTVVPPRLCVIGDPKQSIYRFRGADVSVWTAILQRFADLGIAPVRLTRNYRSRAPIMGFVNATFDGLMGEATDAVMEEGHEVSFGPLVADRDIPGDDRIVEVCTVATTGKADAPRILEAEWIASRILDMVKHDRLVHDAEDAETAPLTRTTRFGDIALLFRSRTGLESYERALSTAGIPFVVNRGGGFFAERSVRDVRLLLEAIADPLDNIAWFGLLRSPFVGLRDETIVRFALENRYESFSRILDQDEPPLEGDILRSARSWMDTIRPLRDRVPVAQLIRHAIATSGYQAQAMFRADGDGAVANLHKLTRMADGMLECNVAEFVTMMAESEGKNNKEKDASLHTSGEDVVTLTTVHSAKGLEWPVVFLPDLGRDIVSGMSLKAKLYFDPKNGVGINEPDNSAAHAVLRARERALLCSEEKRMWYVAATRARDYLVLCVPEKDPLATDSPPSDGVSVAEKESEYVHEWLLRAVGGFGVEHGEYGSYVYEGRTWNVRHSRVADKLETDRPSAIAQPARAVPTMTDILAAPTLNEDAKKRIASVTVPNRLARRSATELMLLDKDPDVHRNRYVLGIRERRLFHRGGDGKLQVGVAATIMGEVMHASLEEQLADADLDAFHERELSQRLGEPTTSTRVRAAAAKLRLLVEAARSNPEVAKLYDSASSERELPFTWIRHTDDGEAAIIQGAMDLVGTPAGGAVEILDFKSHALKQGAEKAKAAEYDLQRDLYAEALRAILGQDPSRFTFYFPETNGVVETDLKLESSEDRLARIDRLLTQDSAS